MCSRGMSLSGPAVVRGVTGLMSKVSGKEVRILRVQREPCLRARSMDGWG